MKKLIIAFFSLTLAAVTPVTTLADTLEEVVEAAKKAPKNQNLNREAGDALKDPFRIHLRRL